ncbi:MAG: hypothetical protein HDR19_02015 [Lachnospiraceae bacterium]|nr:hypothetical protein [Lachnospiraceae bacterium]
MEKVKYSCQEFELFKGNVCHMVKEYGQLQFLEDTLVSNQVEKLWNEGQQLYALYLLAMVDYLSGLNNIPLYTKYNYLRNHKIQKKVYPLSLILAAKMDDADIDELAKDAIPEFLRFNIVEGNVFDVV